MDGVTLVTGECPPEKNKGFLGFFKGDLLRMKKNYPVILGNMS